MKISSVDNNCSITIERTGDPGGYAGFQMEVRVDIGHGQFYAKNGDVQFLKLEEFVSEFDRFILDRNRTPRLEGTYDTYLAFSASGPAVVLQYRLGDAHCGRKTVHFYQSGEFEVEQGHLLQYLSGFQALAER
jgi:hypothetical protein